MITVNNKEVESFEEAKRIIGGAVRDKFGIDPYAVMSDKELADPLCNICKGTGTMYLSDGHDDVNAEVCDCITCHE